MPADDLVINVRQIAGYPDAGPIQSSDDLLIQRAGLGGPYLSTDAQTFVSTALQGGGPFSVNWPLPTNSGPGEVFAGHYNTSINGGSGYNAYYDLAASDAAGSQIWRFMQPGPAASLTFGALAGWEFNIATSQGAAGAIATMVPTFAITEGGGLIAQRGTLTVARDPIAPLEVATAQFVAASITVNSVQKQTGDVWLTVWDIPGAAPLNSPYFTGEPRAPTPDSSSNSSRIATTAFVTTALFNVNAAYAPIDSPNFTGVPTAPTAAVGTSDGQLATTSFVMAAVQSGTTGVISFNGRGGVVALLAADISGAGGALLLSPVFVGTPQAPTATAGTSSQQLATCAFVQSAVAASIGGVSSFNTRTGVVTLTSADIAAVGVASFNGRIGAVGLIANDLSAAGGALLASPAFTGTPTAPTPAPGSNSTAIATTAFVANALSAIGTGVLSFNSRTGAVTLSSADLIAAGGALLASPAFTGTPTAPTPAPGSNSTTLATTAFVAAAISSAPSGVSSFNSRTGAITLTSADLTAAGGALTASPAFTGAPTAPTPAGGSNSTAIATTAFVAGAISGIAAGVSSFNTRIGAVTLTSGDLTAAGGAPLASPGFTGIPTAPTATLGTNTTQLATTAFVLANIGSGAGVTSFNTRTGAITLTGADITAAGGALLAGPTFTGVPAAPTAAPGTSSTQLATTAFVQAGVVNGSNAPSGQIGEVVTAQQLTNVALTNGTPANITSISLTAGDWDVDGLIYMLCSAAALGNVNASVSLTSATLGAVGTPARAQINITTTGNSVCMPTGRLRVNVSTTTTVYLVAQASFSSGTCNGQGTIQARRMR